MSGIQLAGQRAGLADIALLAVLLAAAKQDDQHAAALRVVHPVAGAMIDLEFAHATGKGRCWPGLPKASRSIRTWMRSLASRSRKASNHASNASVFLTSIMQAVSTLVHALSTMVNDVK